MLYLMLSTTAIFLILQDKSINTSIITGMINESIATNLFFN